MPNLDIALRKPVAGILAVLTLACLGLSACGGSSGSSTKTATSAAATTSASTTSASTSTSTSPGGPSTQAQGGALGRFSAIRECLQKNGVTLPKGAAGSGGPAGAGIFLGAVGRPGGPQLPKGTTRAQLQAALKKCGGGDFGARVGRPGAPRSPISSPVFRQMLAKFAVCLRQNGVDIPTPNTSGNGPIFNIRGIKTTSPQFRAASAKCRSVLVGAFRGLRRPNAAAGTGAAPSAGGQGSESSG